MSLDQNGFRWTPRHVHLAVLWYRLGISYTRIGNNFGISRSAVSGKLYRMGIKRGGSTGGWRRKRELDREFGLGDRTRDR